jgi:hypothetical protein
MSPLPVRYRGFRISRTASHHTHTEVVLSILSAPARTMAQAALRRRGAVMGAVLVGCGGGLATVALPAAGAATPVTPASLTNCGGSLSPDSNGKAAGEPYLLDYKITCDGAITAYTIIFNQQGDHGSTLDDYNPSPSVFQNDGVTPSSTESATCEGTTPSAGVNCNFGAGGKLSAGYVVAGSVDPVAQYCKHLPRRSRRATYARAGTAAIPQGIAQLVVTDSTGAQDGPFKVRYTAACPKVPNVVPAAKAKKAKKATSSHTAATRRP